MSSPFFQGRKESCGIEPTGQEMDSGTLGLAVGLDISIGGVVPVEQPDLEPHRNAGSLEQAGVPLAKKLVLGVDSVSVNEPSSDLEDGMVLNLLVSVGLEHAPYLTLAQPLAKGNG